MVRAFSVSEIERARILPDFPKDSGAEDCESSPRTRRPGLHVFRALQRHAEAGADFLRRMAAESRVIAGKTRKTSMNVNATL